MSVEIQVKSDRDIRKRALIDRINSGEETLSYSSLSQFAENPKCFIEYKLKELKQTDAMLYGQVLHCLILEPNKFDERYAIAPDVDRRTKDGKERYAEFVASCEGKAIISHDIYMNAVGAKINVYDNYSARNILMRCNEREKGIEWEYMNFKFRGFIDATDNDRLIIDIKTCADANPKKIHRDIIAMDYHLQAAMYLIAIGRKIPYYIIAVDKSGGVSVHLLEEKLIDVATDRYKFLMDKFNACILLNAWDRNYDFYSERKDGIFICEKPNYMY